MTDETTTFFVPYGTRGRLEHNEVRDVMRAGFISIAADAPLHDVQRAIVDHRVHGILVIARSSGEPLGWATAEGLLRWLQADPHLTTARDAITEPPRLVHPSATVHEALTKLREPGVTRLLVGETAGQVPEGVVTALDIVELASR